MGVRLGQHPGYFLLGERDVGLRQELGPGAGDVTGQVSGDHVLGRRATFFPIVEQLEQRWFVCDDDVHLLGVRLGQGQRAHRAAAGTENHGWTGVQVGDEPEQVVGAHLRRRVPVALGH